jgi:hypothetical protein
VEALSEGVVVLPLALLVLLPALVAVLVVVVVVMVMVVVMLVLVLPVATISSFQHSIVLLWKIPLKMVEAALTCKKVPLARWNQS